LHFGKPNDYFTSVSCDAQLLTKLKTATKGTKKTRDKTIVSQSVFAERNLDEFVTYEEAYHQLIADIVSQQIKSTNLVLKGTGVKKIFVDGGFSKNAIYMHLLAKAFSSIEVYAASVPQASALGAALAIHQHWNLHPLPTHIIDLKLYTVSHNSVI
jgi:glycerol kinase